MVKSSCSLVAGGAVSKTDPSSTGLNPAWRTALLHAVAGVGWPEGASSTVIKQLRGVLKGYAATLHDLAPDSGAYLNEVRVIELVVATAGTDEHREAGP